jgi:hypothetical protein
MKQTKYLHGDVRVKVSAWEPKWIDMILGGSNISFYFTEEEAADERRLYAISILLQAVISTLNKKEPRAQLGYDELCEKKFVFFCYDFLYLHQSREQARRFLTRVCELLERLPSALYEKMPEDIPQYEADVRAYARSVKESLKNNQEFDYWVC